MKKLTATLALSTTLLIACGSNEYSADINNPTIDEETIEELERKIEINNKSTARLEEKIEEDKKKESVGDFLVETNQSIIDDNNREIEGYKKLIEEAKNTQVYNEEFKVFKDLAHITVKQEATLSLKHTKNEYDSLMIERLNFYRKNGLLDRDVISTLILPISGDIKTVAISTYLDKDTVSKLDFEDEELSIIDEADAIYAHGSLSEYITPEYYKLTDEQHSAFFYEITGLMNTTIED